ncbi:uncharacterized protein UV8b_05560 [Ustilaginoidea virens]|uniref:Uncharacterized protein n=1 Tax=Ustilaginoidea virens TaxID=1159556 RepID=A0A063BYG6_USTVR|nr:uncharacterized protein UV8b_05560 [Ustilaginoidea virens]QUC21317.1 hypothetical protein UV8b_05560 [Ustilaginoidea virens]GAO17330.1 hypothetical protein UVI_02044870 [Ustilaginoidea virens]
MAEKQGTESSSTDPNQCVLIPLKLDAFVFNKPVCDGIPPPIPTSGTASAFDAVGAKIAPIEQPNYTFLRLNSSLVQPDIQNPIDLYNSWPAEFNSRFTNLGSEKAIQRRVGVYLHWTLPRLFRSGVAAAGHDAVKSQSFSQARASRGLSNEQKAVDFAPPVFPSVPNRWLVIRHIADETSIFPESARSQVPKFAAWVVESDRMWDLKDLDVDVDLQTDVSPFIAAGDGSNDEDTVSKQAEVFIGKKTPLQEWDELYEPPSAVKEGYVIEFDCVKDKPPQPQAARFLPHFSLLSSSNPLFADYQPHNSNVFSMCDNFEYAKGQFLSRASAHYYVVGWNAKPADDLFTGPLLGNQPQSRKERLNALKLRIKLEDSDGKQMNDDSVGKIFETWLKDEGKTRAVCHGAMYQVDWNSEKKPDIVPADGFCTQLNSTIPLAVGTTPLDALTTYARAHTCLAPPSGLGNGGNGMEDKDPVTVPKLERWITELERHLLSRDDGVESQNQASDFLYNWNFVRADGGQRWNAAGMEKGSDRSGGTPIELIETLRGLNLEQGLLDASLRAMVRLRKDMFSLWWQCVTDPLSGEKENTYKGLVSELEKRFNKLEATMKACDTTIQDKLAVVGQKVKPGAAATFYQQRDPTLLVGGVNSGWQPDYLDKLLVRLDEQTLGSDSDRTIWGDFDKMLASKLPSGAVQSSIKALVSEFLFLGRPDVKPKMDAGEIPTTKTPPLFHDQLSVRSHAETSSAAVLEGPIPPPAPPSAWRDRWNRSQPWFPLFFEWEVEYYHIPFEDWRLSAQGSRSSTLAQLRYGIPGSTKLGKKNDQDLDKNAIQGRALLLPQPSFSLAAKIEQLFAGTPKPILDHKDPGGNYDYLSPEDRESLQKELHQLAFLSAPLAGLTAQLTTVFQGNHIKPNLRDARTGGVEPMVAALRPGAGFNKPQLRIIDIQTDDTPFCNSVKSSTTAYSLFKPATHGQFRFTKINIIDKFGQVIHAIDPTPDEKSRQPVWPCISEWYAPQLKDGPDKHPNVIDTSESKEEISGRNEEKQGIREKPPQCPPGPAPEACEFMQIPPMINQLSRLNSSFVVRSGSEKETKDGEPKTIASTGLGAAIKTPFWRPANEWENPIWGWVLINYANQGIQLFTQDGTFYREVRFGGPKGAQSTPAWLPFRPPSDKALDALAAQQGPSGLKPEVMQLQRLATRLGGDVEFMRAFWKMIVHATENMQPAPEAYAGFTNAALVGRPLALANAGWSLEMAADELVTQATGDQPVKRKLLGPKKKKGEKNGHDCDSDTEEHDPDPSRYAFRVKIGDKQRGFDGLVGVFKCSKSLDPETSPDLGVNMDKLYSDYLSKEEMEEQNSIVPTRPLVLRSHFVDPLSASDSLDFYNRRNEKLSIRSLLLDPFSPIHAYSGILPVRELSLPPWTWQGALSKMKAFFHLGPLVLTKDVPGRFERDRELTSDSPVVKVPDVRKGEGYVNVPALAEGAWVWLQPYYVDKDSGNPTPAEGEVCSVDDGEKEALERYMVLPTAAEDERARFEEGPATTVEGYLMKVGDGKKSSGGGE